MQIRKKGFKGKIIIIIKLKIIMEDRNLDSDSCENMEKFTKIWELADNIGRIVSQYKISVRELKRVQKDLNKSKT